MSIKHLFLEINVKYVLPSRRIALIDTIMYFMLTFEGAQRAPMFGARTVDVLTARAY